MLESTLAFRDRIIELQGWGWNWLTVSFVITLLFDAAEAWTVALQMRTVKREPERHAESLSVKWFCYFGCLLIALGCYGVNDGSGRISIAMLGEGVLGLGFYVPMMLLLGKVRDYSRTDKAVLAGSVIMIPIVALLPWKDLWVLLFSGGAIFAMATMPWEIYRNRSRGQVELGLTLVYLVNVFFWMIYGFAAAVFPLMVAAPAGVIILLFTVFLWYVYPAGPKR